MDFPSRVKTKGKDTMKTLRQIARNIANGIAENAATIFPADTIPPRVFLDDFIGAKYTDGAPVVIVIPRATTGLVRGDRTHTIDLLIGIDVATLAGNMAQSESGGCAVEEFGDGETLERITDNTINYLRSAEPGAVLDEAEVEYDLTQLPMQFAVLNCTYKQAGTY